MEVKLCNIALDVNFCNGQKSLAEMDTYQHCEMRCGMHLSHVCCPHL